MNSDLIYLSKSNRANPDYVMLVRRHFEELGYGIIEHQGGEYNESLLYQCKTMVMVGIDPATVAKEGWVTVGKGQYNQLKNRRSRGINANFYFSHTDDDNKPAFRRVVLGHILDSDNWTTGYGKLKVKMSSKILIYPAHPGKATKDIPEWTNQGRDGSDDDVDLFDPRTRWKHLACITLFN